MEEVEGYNYDSFKKDGIIVLILKNKVSAIVLLNEPDSEVKINGKKVKNDELFEWLNNNKKVYVKLHKLKERYGASVAAEFCNEFSPTT